MFRYDPRPLLTYSKANCERAIMEPNKTQDQPPLAVGCTAWLGLTLSLKQL